MIPIELESELEDLPNYTAHTTIEHYDYPRTVGFEKKKCDQSHQFNDKLDVISLSKL